MDLKAFKASLQAEGPPEGLTPALEALWYEAKGDWRRAHDRLQNDEDRSSSWVHAYLHRREGDAGNAAHWYRRAGQPVATGPLEIEWEALVTALLPQGPFSVPAG